MATLPALGLELADEITFRQRAHFSVSHLLSAAYFSTRVGEIERSNAGAEFGAFWDEILSNASGCIITAFAGLEAYANEIYIDHADNFPEYKTSVIQELWKTYERKRVREKLKFALLLKGVPTDAGSAVWENVECLESLRDARTHFKAEWTGQQRSHSRSVQSWLAKLSQAHS